MPFIVISPEVGVSSRMISLRKVLLPAPEAPTINTNSALSMCRLTLWSALVPLGYVLDTFSKSITVSPTVV